MIRQNLFRIVDQFTSKVYEQAFFVFYRADCANFGIPEEDFSQLDDVKIDIETYEAMWQIFEEFNGEIVKLRKEDWISFR